MLLIKNSKK